MKPRSSINLPWDSLVFNYWLSHARPVIENIFGVAASWFLIFQCPKVANVIEVQQITKIYKIYFLIISWWLKTTLQTVMTTVPLKLLGANVDNKLNFENHIADICSKASWKIYALAREVPYMNLSRRRILVNAFLNS